MIETIKKWFGIVPQETEQPVNKVVTPVDQEGRKYYPDGSLHSIIVDGKVRYFGWLKLTRRNPPREG